MILNKDANQLTFSRLEMLETIRQMTELLARAENPPRIGLNRFYHTMPMLREADGSGSATHYASTITIALETEVKKS